MQQHPVPQNVTQYQFRLVGDMTLKQFLELAGGMLLAYLIYASNLFIVFKLPLALLGLFLGIALAFFPIEDRPLDVWFINFVKSIYAPTRFIWKKTERIPSLFLFSPHPITNTVTAVKTIKAPPIALPAAPASDLSDLETSHLTTLNSLFSALPAPAPTSHTTPIFEKPSVTVRKLTLPSPAVATDVDVASPVPVVAPIVSPPIIPPPPVVTPPPTTIFVRPTPTPAANLVTTPPKPISLPLSPQRPNLVVGVTTDPAGKLVEGAIVQIVDATGLPARAMKTNALGQFATATPLSPGTYTVEVDSGSHTFSPQQLVISDQIIPPFELRATA
ncbi:MAG: Cell wall-plasma membrane linker protein [Microgenomates group bacterium GW2011_GWD1_47_13]|nr:MAG: Cell wall-plasma membrane linker protein [Microgenomates group bacterium GW2011_GWA1_46_7]KKU62351.1 MAG: Cell wall-plasma membrane linker protein [Microgenomates group bacterium GW2011_GWD1_47_13]